VEIHGHSSFDIISFFELIWELLSPKNADTLRRRQTGR
jgi:hypothetical protein